VYNDFAVHFLYRRENFFNPIKGRYMAKYDDSLKFFMSKGFHNLSWRSYSNLNLSGSVEEYKDKVLDDTLVTDKKLFDMIIKKMTDRSIMEYFSKHISVRDILINKGRREVLKKLKTNNK